MFSVSQLVRSLRSVSAGVAAVLVVVGCQQTGIYKQPAPPTPVPAPAPAPAPPTVIDIDAADFAFTTPDSLPAGLVTLRMRNHGQEAHHGQFLRLKDGVSLDQFMSALQRGAEPEAAAMVFAEGGPGLIDPRFTAEVSLDLKPGEYILACFVPGPDGVPYLAKGMLKPVQVVPSTTVSTTPSITASLTVRDFTIDMPESLPPGRSTYRVTNLGPQPHEIGIVRLSPGATVEDILGFYKRPTGEPPFQSVGGINGLDVGGSGLMTLDLQPGEYAAVCLIPDPASRVSHVHLGMIHRFSVNGQ
jgi:hypothetical protein